MGVQIAEAAVLRQGAGRRHAWGGEEMGRRPAPGRQLEPRPCFEQGQLKRKARTTALGNPQSQWCGREKSRGKFMFLGQKHKSQTAKGRRGAEVSSLLSFYRLMCHENIQYADPFGLDLGIIFCMETTVS